MCGCDTVPSSPLPYTPPSPLPPPSTPQAIELINKLTLELNVHEAMRSVRQVALELLDCERCTLFLILKAKQELRGRTGTADDQLICIKFGEGIAGHVAQNGERWFPALRV